MASTNQESADTFTREDLDGIASNDFEAALTPQEVEEYEASQNTTWGVKRRITLITLTQSKAEMVLNFGKDDKGADVLLDMLDHAREWKDHLQAGIDLSECAMARIIVACSAISMQQEQAKTAGA